MRVVREVLLTVIPTSQHACSTDSNEGQLLLSNTNTLYEVNNNGEWMSIILTEMFDLLLIFLHKGFMLSLLLFFGLFNRFRVDINNALWRTDSGRYNHYRLYL